MQLNGWERLEGRTRIKVSVAMDPELLRQADRFWRVNGVRSRSALVEEALRIYLENNSGDHISARTEV